MLLMFPPSLLPLISSADSLVVIPRPPNHPDGMFAKNVEPCVRRPVRAIVALFGLERLIRSPRPVPAEKRDSTVRGRPLCDVRDSSSNLAALRRRRRLASSRVM